MKIELEAACNFVAEKLKEWVYDIELTEEMIVEFKQKMNSLIAAKFEGHWYPDKPLKGSAYRCIQILTDESYISPVLLSLLEEIEWLNSSRLLGAFRKGVSLWIDPNDVSCKLGKGAIFPVYRKLGEPKISNSNPQQRPRSISPPQVNPTYLPQQQRPRSTTPPGFKSQDAGQMYQNYTETSTAPSSSSSDSLWNTNPDMIPSFTPSTSYNRMPTSTTFSNASNNMGSTSYTSFVSMLQSNYSTTQRPSTGPSNDDWSYSFNQYSSYYQPKPTWKRNTRAKAKPMWQDQEAFKRYHWYKDSSTTAQAAGSENNFVDFKRMQEVF
jgi:protein Tob/BTG